MQCTAYSLDSTFHASKKRRCALVHAPCRIGINSGQVIGSIVGIQKFVYDIFGPGVNLAARMETHSEPMRITLCEDMYELIKYDFNFSERGEFEIKGFGKKKLYFLEGEPSK